MLTRRPWPGAIAAALVALLGGVAAFADSLPIRDQNPLLRGAYLPVPAPARLSDDGWSLASSLQWSNTVNLGSTRRKFLRVDEETAELDLTVARDAGPWRMRATLPVIRRSSGVLDGFIDSWHRFFGLPQGDRPVRPRNAYALDYGFAGGATTHAPAGSDFGDLALEVGRELVATAGGTLTLWAGVEAPTGGQQHLTGNGALDEGLWVAGEWPLSSRWALSGRAGATYLGGDGPMPFARSVRFGTVTATWRATGHLDGVVQFDAHSAIASGSGLAFLGHVVELTIGGRYRVSGGPVLEFGVVEDIEVDHSPDVTFQLGMRWPVGVSAR